MVVNQRSDLWRKQSWCWLLWLHRRSLLSPQSDSLSTRGKEMSTQLCFCVLKETSFCQFMKLPRKLNEWFFPNLHISALQKYCKAFAGFLSFSIPCGTTSNPRSSNLPAPAVPVVEFPFDPLVPSSLLAPTIVRYSRLQESPKTDP